MKSAQVMPADARDAERGHNTINQAATCSETLDSPSFGRNGRFTGFFTGAVDMVAASNADSGV
mgnify:CR=1 FL=1